MKAFVAKFENHGAMRSALERAYKHAAQAVSLGPHEVVVRRAIKSRDQEEHYHALIADIAEQYEHFGRKWHREDMKRLMVDAFKHDTINDSDLAKLWAQMGDMRLVPAIGRDGFVPLGEQTRRFPKALATAFIDWLYAFMAENHIRCTDPKWQQYQEAA